MPTLRRGTGQTRISAERSRPVILLDSESPYASRRVVVEYDGTTTAAYLHDKTGPIAATWIANHQRAPESTDAARLSSGQAPEMPAEHTKHPEGTPLLESAALRALWFEEGDGVAVLERDEPLAVLPGWANMSKGMPGYSRDVIGQTPFSWSLDDAMEGLGPRIAEATEYWRWRSDESAWPGIQQAELDK